MIGEARGFRRTDAGVLARQRVEFQRQRTFRVVGIELMQLLRRDQAEHAVAEELQPFVGTHRIGARMGKRALEQVAILEDVAEARFEISRWG